jgi:flagellar hook-basal body complex protein FliE
MSSMQVNAVLAQIRAMQTQIHGVQRPANEVAQAGGVGAAQPSSSFANVLKQGLDQVNQAQTKSDQITTQFERGVPGIELPQVMLEMQKANVSFRALTEVRNRFVSAYQDIMNMPI